ncbi:hypothetical protein OAY89_00980 [Bacteroidota bacterium]|nr:hypothetical protein [Bacteroidota bacterium]
MKKLILLLFIPLVSFGQQDKSLVSPAKNHPAISASAEIIKTCNYWSSIELPIIMNPESRLDGVHCEKGAFIFTINLYEYLSNESTNTKVLEALNNSFLLGVNNNNDFSPFRDANWQIAYLFYDKNKKYLFSLVYDKDINKVDEYFRNVGVELGINMNLKN